MPDSCLSHLKSEVFQGKVGVFDSDLISFCQVEAGMRKRGISCDASTSVEVSNQSGLQSHEVFTGGAISHLATGNRSPSLGEDCQREVANDGPAIKIQDLTEAYHRFSSTRNAFDSSSHDNLSTSTRLVPLHDIEMSQEFKMGKAGTMVGKAVKCQKMDIEATEFECRKYTPSNAQWAYLSSNSSNHSENSVKCWGRQYSSENDYSHSLTLAGGILLDRKVSNSMDTDTKLFEKQAQEHAECFSSEEKSLVEDENMDYPSAMNSNGKGFGSLTKKSTKNILTDSSKHNSPICNAVERFCQSISTSSTVKRPKKALMGPLYSKSTNLEGQASVKKNRTESKKRYGSSATKEDSKTSMVRVGSNFANRISPRISQKPSYTLCNLKSFIPLVQQKQAATSIMTRKSGKRDVKVKALEAAEVAKQLEERREQDRKMRKELGRRGELEKKLLEKSKEINKGKREGTEFECRKYTPSNAQWAHLSSNSSNHSENSVKCWGRQYPSENDYSHSLTLAGGILLDRKVSNSMDTDSKLFEKQAQEHAVCFSTEEKSLVEDENMDHPSAMNSNGKGFGSLTKKSTKNILTDSSKHNSPISTAGERFCQSISTSSTAKRPKKALTGPIYSKSTNLEGQASVKKKRTESKKRYGSPARKEDSKTSKVRAGSNFASQISPRISQKPSYTLCNLKSFIPLVQQKQAATSIMTRKSGKRDVKVKALEAAEVAKQLEERREQDRKMRKELARHGELEKKLLEKSKELNKGEREGTEFECRKYTPSNAQWAHLSSNSSNHSENSVKCWGRQYPSENDYSHSLTLAGGILLDRKVSNSMDTDSKLFEKQAQEHAVCFSSEEKSMVEDENMDHPSAMNSNGKGFGSLTKKSTKILTDLSKHNSPISTAGERFCQSISTSSTAKRPKKALMGPIYSKSTNIGGQASVKKNRTESKKRYGSSARKEDSKTSKVRAGSNFASQISPRISQKPSYTICNLKSFIPLVQQKQAATSIMTRKSGKRDVKVKALEAAEVAKQLEERREQDRKMRKELARRGELEKKLLEKSKELNKWEREGKESSIACSDINKSILSGMARKQLVQSQEGTSVIGVDLKLRRAFEAKTKLEQEKLRKLEEKKRREEIRKKNAAEVAANKRKREQINKTDREEKRRRFEVVQKQKKELEKNLRAEKEAKEHRRRALDDSERMRKAMEEEAKKQRRIEKERDAAERRRQIEENAKSNKFASKDAKHMQEFRQHNKTTLQAQNACARKVN